MKKLLASCAIGLASVCATVGATVGIATYSTMAHAIDRSDLRSGHPDSYRVVKGDTLWDISKKFLRDPWLWPEIWHVNPQIENPHLIFPGDLLSLVYINGKPRLVVSRGDTSRTIKLSPQVRITPLQSAIPAIPLEKINAFLTRSRILNDDIITGAPYVLAGDNDRIITGAGDKLYARGKFDPDQKVYGIYRAGRMFTDPKTEEFLGMEAVDIGGGKMIGLSDDIATLNINRSNEEIRVNDRLLPFEERKLTATFFPSVPDKDVKGLIIAVEGGVTQIGTLDIVALNKGANDGLEEGNVMEIYKTGEIVRDRIKEELIQLPDTKAGLMMIFRAFDKMAYGIVLDASQPLSVMDKFKKPRR